MFIINKQCKFVKNDFFIVSVSSDHDKSSNIWKLEKCDRKNYVQVGANHLEEEILNDLKHQFVLSEEGEEKISELVKNSREWIGVP